MRTGKRICGAGGLMLAVCLILGGCGASDRKVEKAENSGSGSSQITQMAETDSSVVTGKLSEYTADIDAYEICFSSVDGLVEMEPMETAEIVRQDFYVQDASHSIDVGFVPAQYADAFGDFKTAEEYRNYPWEETVTQLTVLVAEDISIDGWDGFYYEYHDDTMGFDASGYYFFNEAGDRVDFTQIKRQGTYLPLQDIHIK